MAQRFLRSLKIGFVGWVLPVVAFAQSPIDALTNRMDVIGRRAFNQPNITSGYAARDVLVIKVAQIFGVFLSLLGFLFIVLIMYGGYLYMTARGNEQQVETATNIIRQSIIGVIIIMISVALSAFILGNLVDITGAEQF